MALLRLTAILVLVIISSACSDNTQPKEAVDTRKRGYVLSKFALHIPEAESSFCPEELNLNVDDYLKQGIDLGNGCEHTEVDTDLPFLFVHGQPAVPVPAVG